MNKSKSSSSNRVSNPELKAWKQTFIIDSRQLRTHHKDLSKSFSFSSTLHPWNEIVSKTIKETDQKQLAIENEEKKIASKLKEIISNVNSLKSTLENYEHTNQFLVKVQNSSEGIYSKIEKFKSHMSTEFQQMIDEEEALEADLKIYDEKIASIIEGSYEGGEKQKPKMQENLKNLSNKENKRLYSAKNSDNEAVKKAEIPGSVQSGKLKAFELRSEQIVQQLSSTEQCVEGIESKINALGKNLGWVEEDHSDFLKIWNRGSSASKNYFEMEDELTAFFKLYTEEQIRDHMNKHLKHKKLTEEKREKILEYKALKEEKKVIEFEMLAEQEEGQRAKQLEQKCSKKSAEDQVRMKEKVSEWKEKKRLEKEQEAERKRQQEERKREENLRRVLENEEKKEALEQWREEQEEIKSKKLIESRKHSAKPSIDKETEERIRAREEKLIADKMEGLMKKKIEDEEKLKKEERLKEQKFVKYSYVNSKLQEKTTAIKQKERGKFDGKQKKDANTFGGNLLHAGVRATPGWMQGL